MGWKKGGKKKTWEGKAENLLGLGDQVINLLVSKTWDELFAS